MTIVFVCVSERQKSLLVRDTWPSLSLFPSPLFLSILYLPSSLETSPSSCSSSSCSCSSSSFSFEASRVIFKLEDKFFLVYLHQKKGKFSMHLFLLCKFSYLLLLLLCLCKFSYFILVNASS